MVCSPMKTIDALAILYGELRYDEKLTFPDSSFEKVRTSLMTDKR